MNLLKILTVTVLIVLITICFTGCPSNPKEYTIIASSSPNGTIDPSGEITVVEGESRTFNMQPDFGASILDVKVDNASIGSVSSYVFSDVTANHSIHASFSSPYSPEEYTITASSGPNGTIDPSGEITVVEGNSQTFTMLPNSDASILDVEVDSASIGPVSSYVFSDVTEDHTIHVIFLALTGSWSGSSTIESQPYPLNANLTQVGDSLGGTAELYVGATLLHSYNIDLTIVGDSLSGQFLGIDEGETNVYDWDVNATVNVDGTEMTGSIYIPESGASGTFTLTKS